MAIRATARQGRSRHRASGRVVGALVLAITLAVTACSDGSDDPLGQGGGGGSAAPGTGPPPCRQDRLPDHAHVLRTGADPAAVAAAVAEGTHRCSEVAVVAPAGDAWAAALAAPLALAEDAPLLLIHPTDPAQIRLAVARLDPEEVLAVGVEVDPGAWGPSDVTTTAILPATGTPAGASAAPVPGEPAAGPSALGLAVARHLGSQRIVAVPVDDTEARAGAAGHLEPGDALLPLPADAAQLDSVAASLPPGVPVIVLATDPGSASAAVAALVAAGVEARAVPGPLWPEPWGGTVWLVDPAQGPVAAVAAVAAAGRGEPLLPVTAADLRSGRQRTRRVRAAEPERAVLVGDVTADAAWQLPIITAGPELPGGGFRLFEGQRMVALYGHPIHNSLGALGEQDLDASVHRARAVAAPYEADGARVLPAFEVIATVASAEAGTLGDYSRRTPVELLRPYVERAATEDLYVVLDLQPGRTDFLTQAKEYEELLLEPHVGLALDPEWRLLPDQVHLRQVGSVAAGEVQQVVDWLAGLTRRHQLPEKLLVLHQFRSAMLPDRDTITDPPELAIVVHMDGQGPIGSKDGTYRTITAGAEDRWLWGWKNFLDEDQPTPSPQHVLALDPLPVFVSYQ